MVKYKEKYFLIKSEFKMPYELVMKYVRVFFKVRNKVKKNLNYFKLFGIDDFPRQ